MVSQVAETSLPAVSQLQTVAGKGLSAECEGHQLLLGNQRLLSDAGIDVTAAEEELQRASLQGATPVLLAIDGQLAALLAITDPLSPETVPAVAQLLPAAVDKHTTEDQLPPQQTA